MIAFGYYLAATLFITATIAYAAHAASHGDLLPLTIACVLHVTYALTFLFDAVLNVRRARGGRS